jgi:hypothetical protein
MRADEQRVRFSTSLRCGVQLGDTQDRRIADTPAEEVHLLTFAWLLQPVELESGVAASLIGRESHFRC